jgi:YfiH family protein
MKPSPAVSPDFRFRPSAAGRVLVSAAVEAVADHLFTTRQLQFREHTLSDDYEQVAAAFHCLADSVVRVRQVHGREVLIVRPGEALASAPEADAIVSTDPTRVISVRTADCVPIIMADRLGRAVAVVHAGWRGTAAEVAGATVEILGTMGVPASDVVAAIGPAIGPCCYQVDDEVRDAFGATGASACFSPDGPGHWRLDLARANLEQLTASGVSEAVVSLAGACTSHQTENWFSYRREGRDAGRMVAAVRLGPPTSHP